MGSDATCSAAAAQGWQQSRVTSWQCVAVTEAVAVVKLRHAPTLTLCDQHGAVGLDAGSLRRARRGWVGSQAAHCATRDLQVLCHSS